LIAGCSEYFQNRGGRTDKGFLAALHQHSLGRAVVPTGEELWMQALADGASRTQVAALIFGSPEHVNDLVNGI
jgi:hypothetical protein